MLISNQRDIYSVQAQHGWLGKLHLHIYKDTSNRIPAPQPLPDAERPDPATISDFRGLYPRWVCDGILGNFMSRSPAYGSDFTDPILKDNWTTALLWISELVWEVAPSYKTSFLELAAQAFVDGVRLVPKKGDADKLATSISLLRGVSSAAIKRGFILYPGDIAHAVSKCSGHRLPNGVIRGARVLLSNKALLVLAKGFHRGG